MALTLSAKILAAITGYLQANAATIGIASDHIHSGTSTSEPSGDFLVVSLGKLEPHPELPQVKGGKLSLTYHSAGTVGGSERAGVDAILEKLDTFLMKPPDDNATWSQGNPEAGALLAALNKPASGPDSRTIKPLHFYYFGPSEESNDADTEGWQDQLSYDLIAQPMDSH